MEVIHNIKNYQPKKPSILTIGTFDGLHIGHQKIIRNLVSKAKKEDLCSLVLVRYRDIINGVIRGIRPKLLRTNIRQTKEASQK